MLADGRQGIGGGSPVLVDVRHGALLADHHLRVVLEEVDLEKVGGLLVGNSNEFMYSGITLTWSYTG